MILSTEQVSQEYLALNSCGIQKLYGTDAGSLRPSGRLDYHILYLMEGRCRTPVNGQTVTAEKGDLLLFEPREPQEYYFSKKDHSISCYIHFTGTGCAPLLRELGLTGQRIRRVGTANIIGECFQRMEYELLLRHPFYEKRCSALLLELLTAFGRGLLNQAPEMKFDHRIDRVCKLMIQDCGQWHSMGYYAEECCLSVSRFQHIFRQNTGYSPNEYLMRIRLEQAASLLTRTDLSVSAVAEQLGFQDENYFCRVFRKRFGKSPARYRRETGGDGAQGFAVRE